MTLQEILTPRLGQALRPNIWDAVALILVIGAMVLIVYGGEETTLPLSTLDVTPVSLDPANLPHYALRTTMRMLLAIVCSIIFTFVYAALAAKSRRAEMVLIPLLDILQSVPGLIWNTMMSMSGGWFFVVASEAITVGSTTVTLPGIGSYVALAIEKQNLRAIGYAVLTMLLVIIVYDQLLFRPLVAWADKFR